MDAMVRTRKLGGSLFVRIPKDVVDKEDIKEGEAVEISVKKIKKSGFGALKGIGPFTREDEMHGQVRD